MGELPFERMKRELLVRRESDPSSFGCNPYERTTAELMTNSVVCIDKPRGPTSHQVSAYAAKIMGADKSGHAGTLDPNVTGVLPVAVGKATRVVQAMQPAGKEYICLMHVHEDVPEEKLRETILSFVGKIKQLPPLKSAVKRQLRFRKIYYIDLLEIDGKEVLFYVGCQAGTYIRKLCHDIGQKLGCGAHMASLRRTKAASFTEKELCTLQDLTDAIYYYKSQGNDKFLRKILQPIESGVRHLAKVYVLDSSVDTICHGANLAVPGISKVETDIQVEDLVAIMTLKGELIAIGIAKMISNQMVKEETGIAVSLEAVFMAPGTYPRMQKKD